MPQLVDPFGRHINYLRLSVTDRCDLRCFYCLPKGFKGFSEPDTWLTFDEIERIIGVMTDMGLAHVRITGGEPLVRRDIENLTTRLKDTGLDDLSLSTNATRLSKHAQGLKDAGLDRINVSIDTLNADKFRAITQGKIDKVIDGLMAAKKANLQPIKLNMVLMKGVNDEDIEDMIEFCIKHGFSLRFIETMPMGDTGQDSTQYFMPLDPVKARLDEKFGLTPSIQQGAGPAKNFLIDGTQTHIGFITPMSNHFCESCNRVRLSAEGALYMCLGQSHRFELRPLLRKGISDDELRDALITAIALKPERHEFNEKPEQVVRFMSMTGG